MGSRSKHDPMRAPRYRDSGPAWGPYGSRDGVEGGQGRDGASLTATARDLLRVIAAGLALGALTYGLGMVARACL